ncbi:mitochondrial tRNA methylthiotransferase CDK5RAP1 isoform X2 [Rhinoraja longicauda]
MGPVRAVRTLLNFWSPRLNAGIKCVPQAFTAGTVIRSCPSLGAEPCARLSDGPGLRAFLRPPSRGEVEVREDPAEDPPPYLIGEPEPGGNRSVYFETYGCQMNVNDTEIAWSILQKNGYKKATSCTEADVILLVTCSISSIMRGCNNMCSYCIVPFTRGRERSRPISSILQEVRILSDQGVKEVTLLGQNVNSYSDTSEIQFHTREPTHLSRGFNTIYRNKHGGLRFACLLDQVSQIDPEMRIRFTSPHPKDFPDEVLQLIQERGNICKQIHLPAQSGSTAILEAMRRGYTRETYLELVERIREIIPGVSLSSDFIAGFCGETEDDHLQTIFLLRQVRYNVGYLFAYSMRKKTHASHRMEDSVPAVVKQRRLEELIAVFREEATKLNAEFIGTEQVVLVEGASKRSKVELCGRNDGNIKVIFPNLIIPCDWSSDMLVSIQPGDYVSVQITSANSQSLKGIPVCLTTLSKSTKMAELKSVSNGQ